MKKIFNWRTGMALSLIALSAVLYYLHYGLFHDRHHIFIYLVGDVAFVPIEVLLVTLIIHHLLEKREKKRLLNKMNMLIGAFFSDTGNELLGVFSGLDPNVDIIREKLRPDTNWVPGDFIKARTLIKGYECKADCTPGDLAEIRDFLSSNKAFLMNLLANPNLLEHDSFTDLLWAVFHLAEELAHRKDIMSLPEEDRKHLCGDINRAYKALITEWIDHMDHLKGAYPYLYSLAVRTNPFDPEASVEVR